MIYQSKKYQVFISSTYEDLKDERRAVEETIIRAGDIPVGMEAFPAADEEQFDFIKTIIDDCDYYILIIAGRYGTISEDGLSYTEKEFNYAVEKSIPAIVLVHGEPDKIASGKTERTEIGKAALLRFIHVATERRLRRQWNTADGLKLAVREALDHAKRTKPRPGWIRGSETPNSQLLEEINELRKKNEILLRSIPDTKKDIITVPDLADISSNLNVYLTIKNTYTDDEKSRNLTISFLDIFRGIGLRLETEPRDTSVRSIISVMLAGKFGDYSNSIWHCDIDDDAFYNIRVQLELLGFIKTESSEQKGGGKIIRWMLTVEGKRRLYDMRASRTPASST